MLSGCPARDPDIVDAPDHEPYSKSAYQAGRGDAEKDLRSGRLIVEIYGFPLKGEAEYAQLLKDRYQIELKRVASDIVDAKAIGHEKGYNEISIAEVKRRFGTDT